MCDTHVFSTKMIDNLCDVSQTEIKQRWQHQARGFASSALVMNGMTCLWVALRFDSTDTIPEIASGSTRENRITN